MKTLVVLFSLGSFGGRKTARHVGGSEASDEGETFRDCGGSEEEWLL